MKKPSVVIKEAGSGKLASKTFDTIAEGKEEFRAAYKAPTADCVCVYFLSQHGMERRKVTPPAKPVAKKKPTAKKAD